MCLEILPASVISHISTFLYSDELINLARCNKNLMIILQFVLAAKKKQKFQKDKAREKWKMIRDLIRLYRRISLIQSVVYMDNWIIQNVSPYQLIKVVSGSYDNDKCLQVKLLVTIGTQDDLGIAIQWIRCISRAFTHGIFKNTADKFLQCLTIRDTASIESIPIWILSATFHLSKIWHEHTGI